MPLGELVDLIFFVDFFGGGFYRFLVELFVDSFWIFGKFFFVIFFT